MSADPHDRGMAEHELQQGITILLDPKIPESPLYCQRDAEQIGIPRCPQPHFVFIDQKPNPGFVIAPKSLFHPFTSLPSRGGGQYSG